MAKAVLATGPTNLIVRDGDRFLRRRPGVADAEIATMGDPELFIAAARARRLALAAGFRGTWRALRRFFPMVSPPPGMVGAC